MNAREFMEQPRRLKEQLEKADMEVDYLKSLAERVTVPFGPESQPVTHTTNVSAMQDAAIKLSEAREKAARIREEYCETVWDVGLLILRIQNETVRDFMAARYLDFKTHAQIAALKNYSPSWGRKTHRRGLIAVQAILDEEKAKV